MRASPLKKLRIAQWMVTVIGAALFLHVLVLVLGRTVFDGRQWTEHPVHAMIEVAGAVAAFAVWFAVLRDERTVKHVLELARQSGDGRLQRALDDLHAKTSFQEAILDSTEYAIIATNTCGTITAFNRGAERMLGYSAAEVEGNATPEIIHDRHEMTTRALELSEELGVGIKPGFEVFVAKVRTGGAEEHEWTYVRKDGSRFPVLLSVTGLRDRDGRLSGFLGIAKDVTLRKDAERACKESEEKFRQLAENVDEIFWITSGDGRRIIYVSPAYEKIWGRTCASLYERPEDWLDGLHAADRERVASAFFERGPKGEFDEEYRVLRPDGSLRWVRARGSIVRDENGQVCRIAGLAWDITERKRQERENKDSEAKMRAVLNTAADAIITIDTSGIVQEFNLAAESIFGYQRGEIIGKNIAILLPQPHRDHHDRYLKDYLTGGQKRVIGTLRELEAVRKDGSRFPIELAVSEVPLDSGRLFTGIVRDISARKTIEAELKAALENSEAANVAKSQFLASMSHELRTPLNGVIGMSELMMDDTQLDGRQRRFVEACHRSGKTLLTLINDILDFSKIEAGKLELEQEEFELATLVEETIEGMAFQANKKGLDLYGRISPHLASRVVGDSVRLGQILVNLISNAIKFTETGEINIRVAPAEDEHGKLVRIDVSDTGVGIPPEKIDTLFNSFTQVDNSTVRQYGGTGLGLAICKRLVEMMGGQIGVRSTIGSGSTFWCEIPFERAAAARTVDISEQLQNRRAILLAVSARLIRFLADAFADWRIAAEVASSADETFRKLQAAIDAGQPFDLVVAEEQAIDLSEFVRQKQSTPEFQHTKLLLISNALPASGGDQIAVDSVVQMPLCQSALLNAINDCVLDRTPQEDSAPKPTATQELPPVPSLRVLLAEDNTTNQLFAREVLQQAGLHCDCVANGEEALVAIRFQPYDLVLMDCHMPVMDGFEATRAIRQMERDGELDNRLPIIALTANAVKGDRERCLQSGMDDYLSKPFERQQLLQLIGQLFSSGSASNMEAATPRHATELVGPADSLPVNHRELLARCMGKLDFAQELLADFETDLPNRIAQISHFIVAADEEGTGKAAHSLKGAAGIVGAEAVRRVAATIEAAGKAGRLEEAASLLSDLNAESTRFLEAMPEIRSELASEQPV